LKTRSEPARATGQHLLGMIRVQLGQAGGAIMDTWPYPD
jgi:hypothetical protein